MALTDPSPLEPLVRRWRRRSRLTDADRQAVLELPFIARPFAKDAYLVREGEKPTYCCLLSNGFAYRQKLLRNGTRQIISIHIPGEFVDLQNCLLGVADHNVQCLNRSEAALIPKDALLELIARRPAVAQALWIETLIDASIFREWVVNVGRRDARSRIAHLLCELAVRLEGSGQGNDGHYEFPLTQEQLGDATGLTPVHTNRTLQALRRDGLISLTAHTLEVLDWQRLREVGDFSEMYLHHQADPVDSAAA